MRLDRSLNPGGRPKYGVLKLRDIDNWPDDLKKAAAKLASAGLLDMGADPATESFVIRLKDQYAAAALGAYGMAAYADDPEYGREVLRLARIAAEHPARRRPD